MQVEFLGIPRERAGVSTLEVHANTLGQLLERLAADIPALAANLNGDRFVSDPQTPLDQHDCVLILSADAGG